MPDFYTDIIMNDSRFKSIDRVADINLLEPVTRRCLASLPTNMVLSGVVTGVIQVQSTLLSIPFMCSVAPWLGRRGCFVGSGIRKKATIHIKGEVQKQCLQKNYLTGGKQDEIHSPERPASTHTRRG